MRNTGKIRVRKLGRKTEFTVDHKELKRIKGMPDYWLLVQKGMFPEVVELVDEEA